MKDNKDIFSNDSMMDDYMQSSFDDFFGSDDGLILKPKNEPDDLFKAIDEAFGRSSEPESAEETKETAEEVKKVIGAYKEGISGNTPRGVFDKITRGHFYRGAE